MNVSDANSMYIIGALLVTKMRTWDGHGNPFEKSMEGRRVYVPPNSM
jgi:hypothetical protein